MVTIKCQYTGIEFEAKSARAKNHPKVAEWLDKANKFNTYGGVLDTITAARKNGAKTIEEFASAINDFYAKRTQSQQVYEQKKADATRKFEEQKAVRKARNKFLDDNGYKWHPHKSMEDDEESTKWELWAPDGIEVSVAQALDEIARGREVVRAEIKAGKTYPVTSEPFDLAKTLGDPMLADK